ncbi:MAG: sulfatase [Actinomycetota bacterium]|nr:sulfatase [Actinomycetota bacterium]
MQRALTRKEFLKLAGAGAAGGALLGASALASGCGPTISGEPGPNVILIILDSLRKDHLGAYGNPWIETPNLDALARESLRFSRAYPESLPTICARRAIHTGKRTWPFRNWQTYKGVDVEVWGWQPIPEGQTTLAEVLKKEGYQTLFITDTLHQFKASMNFQRGFDVFDFIRGQTTDGYRPKWTDPREKVREALVKGRGFDVQGQMRRYFANTASRETEKDWFSPRVFSGAMELMEAAKDQQPFFLVVDSYDPHQPWDPPEEYVSLYDDPYDGPEPYMPVGASSNLTDRQLRRMKALYAAEVTMVDRWLGNLLDKMEGLGLLENTLLVHLADHGIAHGEHGITGKPPYALWPEVTDIPFMIRHPEGKGAGETSDYYASTHDVAPTVLGFLGIEPPEPMDGEDLTVLFEGGEPKERAHFSLGYNDHAWARDENYVMFAKNDGSNALLFDLRADPKMDNDIAGSNQEILNRMWNDYVLKDAGGPLPEYGNERPF